MARILLVLPTATYRAADFIDAAVRLDAEVVVASERRQAMAGQMTDRSLVLDLRRPEAAADAIVALSRRRPLDGLVAVDDQGVLAVTIAAERLGLPHNPPAAVAATRDKRKMRDLLQAGGVHQPGYAGAGPGHDVADVAAAVGFPVVLKPTSLSASRGVIRADDKTGARRAAGRVRAILADAGEDPTAPILVERYVPGAEVAVEGLLRRGTLEVLAVFDKPDPLEGPYFEETLYVTPSRLSPHVLTGVEKATAGACAAIGLVEGPIHAELRIDHDQACMIEVAARSIGGLCSRSLTFGVGLSLEQLIVSHALGRPLESLDREQGAAGVMMLPIPAAGTLESVDGGDRARGVPHITGLEISIAPGRPVRPLPEGDRYLGFLFARADTPEEVETALRRAHGELDIRVAGDPAPDSC